MLIFVRRRSHLDMGPGTYSTRLAIDARHLKTGTGTYTRNLIIGLKELQFGPLHMAAHGAAHIFTVSEYSKRRLIEYLDIDPDKITVVYNGVSNFYSPEDKECAYEAVASRFHFTLPYSVCRQPQAA